MKKSYTTELKGLAGDVETQTGKKNLWTFSANRCCQQNKPCFQGKRFFPCPTAKSSWFTLSLQAFCRNANHNYDYTVFGIKNIKCMFSPVLNNKQDRIHLMVFFIWSTQRFYEDVLDRKPHVQHLLEMYTPWKSSFRPFLTI